LCFDGTGAKYAAWKKFGNKAEYIPVSYGKPCPILDRVNKNTEVYILDFSYPRKDLDDMAKKVAKLIVLDHHKTAENALRGAPYATFDMNKSGAVLAWEYFHPGEKIPTLLLNIEDGDLWKFSLKNTSSIRAALPLLDNSMLKWDQAASNGKKYLELVQKGEVICDANRMKIEGAVKGSVKVLPYAGYKVGVCNTTILTSEIGHAICSSKSLGVDFSMTYFFDVNGIPVVSLRSNPGGLNVRTLAEKLGGGGHHNASGAVVSTEFLTKLYEGKL
jgi:oligoribonuclease NrnB/cAMP/cGMP phosphodiesterase (DHH superfamily)